MLSDITEFEDGHQFEADVAIVGGGPAGMALAMHLSNGSRKVLLLEAGGLNFNEETQAGLAGSQSGLPYFALDASRYRMLGGSTFRWGARSAPMKLHDFTERDWVANSGWPIPLSTLNDYYDQAYDLIDLHRPFAFDDGIWKQVKVRSPGLDLSRFDVNAFQFGRNLLFGTVFRDALRRSENIRAVLNANVL
jgi:choline dehydrogenase-like flavoprotein